ncbi:MAG: globin, partial [Pseudomonadota bacterium]
GDAPMWTNREYLKVVVERMIQNHPPHRFEGYEDNLAALADPPRYVLRTVRQSYAQCRRSPGFFREFYTDFFARVPAAEALFAHLGKSNESKRWQRQQDMVSKALSMLLAYFPEHCARELNGEKMIDDETVLAHFAQHHARQIDKRYAKQGHAKTKSSPRPAVSFEPAWYDDFLDALVQALPVGEIDVPTAEESLIKAMRYQVLRPGAEFLRRQHES